MQNRVRKSKERNRGGANWVAPLGQALGLDSCCWFWVCRLVGALRGQECLRSFGQARQKPRWARREFQKYPLPGGRGQGEGGNGGVEMPLVHCEKSVIHPHPAFGHLLPHREKEMGGRYRVFGVFRVRNSAWPSAWVRFMLLVLGVPPRWGFAGTRMSPLLWSSAAETTMGTKGIPEIPSPWRERAG